MPRARDSKLKICLELIKPNTNNYFKIHRDVYLNFEKTWGKLNIAKIFQHNHLQKFYYFLENERFKIQTIRTTH